jgi:hypothetical protein
MLYSSGVNLCGIMVGIVLPSLWPSPPRPLLLPSLLPSRSFFVASASEPKKLFQVTDAYR